MTHQSYMTPKTRTVSITLSPRKGGWLCQMHYRTESIGEVWGKTAQDALTAVETRAICTAFTHAVVTERGRDGEIINIGWSLVKRHKLTGTTLPARWEAMQAKLAEPLTEPIPRSFPPTPKVRLATIVTRMQHSFWTEVKVKHGNKVEFSGEDLAESSAIEGALKWAANNGFTHYQINTNPVIRELNPTPAPQPETKTCTLLTKAYMGNRTEAIIHDGKKQLHCAAASNAQDAIPLALAWAALHGFTHYTDQHTKKTQPIQLPETVKLCVIRSGYSEALEMWEYHITDGGKQVADGIASTQRVMQTLAEESARELGYTHYKTPSTTSYTYKL